MVPVRESLLLLDAELRVIKANPSFYRTFNLTQISSAGRTLRDYETREGRKSFEK